MSVNWRSVLWFAGGVLLVIFVVNRLNPLGLRELVNGPSA